jgi:hypothetical protein
MCQRGETDAESSLGSDAMRCARLTEQMRSTSGAIQQGVPTKVLRVLGPRQSSSRSGVAVQQ